MAKPGAHTMHAGFSPPRRHPAANQARNDICNYNNCQLGNKMAARAGTSFTPADRAHLAAYPHLAPESQGALCIV